MKSKKTTYLLLAAVVAVWGLILWRVFLRTPDERAAVIPERRAVAEATVADTLVLDYRDPFLGVVAPPKPTPRPRTTPQTAAKPAPPPKPPTLHRLRYLGRITRGGTPHALIEIDGALHTMKKNDTANDYRLTTLWQDSVRLAWKDETCTVRLDR
ncbi:hypothetical protein LJC45_00915 [Alistipes sp. OttesenSCG-928-B03]|nr:hypothetical protein [Alistipes sp. OttesenSCG-928-B03]